MMRWYFVIVLMLGLTCANGKNNQNLLFEKYSLQDGLAGNSIHEIIQDSIGFLWIATESGLSKFDGVSFKNYTKDYNNSFSLPSNVINKLYLDSKGILWVGTNYGICSYDPLLEIFNCFIPHPNLMEGNQMNIVSGIGETSSGIIYFLVESGQLFSIQNGEIQVRLNIESEGSKFMMIDKQDRCWIAAEDIVYHFNVKNNLTTRHRILYPPDVSNSEITDMLLVDSLLYITSYKSDLICYNYLTGNHAYINLLMGPGHTNSIIKEDDYLLIGTSEGLKINNLKTGNIQTYQENISNIKSLSSNAILDLYRDRQGNLWIGTGNGLNVAYRDKGFVGLSYNYNSFKKRDDVRAINMDDAGRLWLSYSQTGIDIFDENFNLIRSYENIPGILPSSQLGEVFTIYKDSKSNIWLATYLNGLLKYNLEKDNFTQYFPGKGPYSLDGADVRSVIEDEKGNIWIAIHGHGLYVLPHGEDSFKPLHEYDSNIPQNINQKWCFQINFDRNNNLWIASNIGCLHYNFNTKEFVHYNQNNKDKYHLSDNYISTLFFDSRGNIWASSRSGLNLIHQDSSATIILDQNNGLPNNIIQAINEDRNGDLWVSTSNGLAKIELLPELNFNITKYGEDQGLSSNAFVTGSTFLSDKNVMFFGGKSGITYFYLKILAKIQSLLRLYLPNCLYLTRKLEYVLKV